MVLDEDALETILDCENVISFAQEARKRGRSCSCLHQLFVIDGQHGTVECRGCGEVVSAFHALCEIAKDESRFRRQWATLKLRYDEMVVYKPWLIAVRRLERLWRGRRMLPCCPHCRRGIGAEDLANSGAVGVNLEQALRKTFVERTKQ